jgi:hypothetical protein
MVVHVKVEVRRQVMDRSTCTTALPRSPCSWYAALVTAIPLSASDTGIVPGDTFGVVVSQAATHIVDTHKHMITSWHCGSMDSQCAGVHAVVDWNS